MEKKTNVTVVHASNIAGFGAEQVVSSLVKALVRCSDHKEFLFIFPRAGLLSSVKVGKHTVLLIKRILPNALSRIIECLCPRLYYRWVPNMLVLGDIPLRKFPQQVVLVHQSNLIAPRINPYSSRSLSFRVMRKVFSWNLKYVKYIVVQSPVMKEQILQSYSILEERVRVIAQPAPSGFGQVKRVKLPMVGMTLFYPAAGYPHKNHQLIQELSTKGQVSEIVREFIVTLNEGILTSELVKINQVGYLDQKACLEYYGRADALFFPSVAESYGLPLVEAMQAGIPIVCANLPYARWMCEDEAIYFDPSSVKSAVEAIQKLNVRLNSGWEPDWSNALSKLPKDWDAVAKQFLELLE